MLMSVTLPDRRAVRLAPGIFRLTFAGKWSILVNEGGIRDKRLAPIMGYKPVLESLHIRTGYFYHLCLFRLRRRRAIMSMIIRMTLSAKYGIFVCLTRVLCSLPRRWNERGLVMPARGRAGQQGLPALCPAGLSFFARRFLARSGNSSVSVVCISML